MFPTGSRLATCLPFDGTRSLVVLKLKSLMQFAFVSLAVMSLACDSADTAKPATPSTTTAPPTDTKPKTGSKVAVPTNAPANKVL